MSKSLYKLQRFEVNETSSRRGTTLCWQFSGSFSAWGSSFMGTEDAGL